MNPDEPGCGARREIFIFQSITAHDSTFTEAADKLSHGLLSWPIVNSPRMDRTSFHLRTPFSSPDHFSYQKPHVFNQFFWSHFHCPFLSDIIPTEMIPFIECLCPSLVLRGRFLPRFSVAWNCERKILSGNSNANDKERGHREECHA
jgi:hypothetical protein